MNAIISGELGAAVLIDGADSYWLDERAARPVPCTAREVRRLAVGVGDATFFEDVTEAAVRDRLRLVTDLYIATTHLTIAVSADSSTEARRRSLVELERLLDQPALADSLRDIAYARVPQNLKSVLVVAREARLAQSVQFLEGLAAHEGAIARVCDAWDIAALSQDDAGQVRSWAVRQGLFRRLVGATLEQRAVRTVKELLATRDEAVLRDVSISRDAAAELLERWLNELQRGFRATVEEWKLRAKDRLAMLSNRIPFARASLQLVDGGERSLFVGRGFDESSVTRAFLRPIAHDRLMSRVAAQRGVLFLPDVNADPDWTPTSDTSDIVAWVGAPLVYHDSIIVGLLTLDFLCPVVQHDGFDEELRSFCNEVPDILWRAGPLYRQQRAERAMQIVKRMVDIFGTDPSASSLLDAIAREVAVSLECSHCTIFLLQGRGDERTLVARHAFGSKIGANPVRFAVGQGLVGRVFATGDTLVVPDATKNEAFALGRNRSALTRSMALSPIKVGDQTIGVICADQDQIGWFRESDSNLLEAVSQQAGLAIQRAHAFDFLESIAEEMLSLRGIDSILNFVLNSAIELVNATTGVIHLLDTRKEPVNIIKTVQFDDFPHPEPRLDHENGITNTVVQTGSLVVISDLATDPRVNRRLHQFKSLIAVPLKIGTDVIGVLFIDDEDFHEFTGVEKRLLTILASLSATAIQKADEMRQHIELQSALETLTNLASTADRVQPVLDVIGAGLCAIFDKDGDVSCAIHLYDAQGDTFKEPHCYGRLAAKLKVMSLQSYAEAVRKKRSFYITEMSSPPHGLPPISERDVRGIRAMACVAMQKGNEAFLGALLLVVQRRMEFTADQQVKLKLFAAQATAALSRAYAHEEVVRRRLSSAGQRSRVEN